MEYPGSRLTKPYRRALLITLIAIFFIVTPLIILYTVGYRYDWGTGVWRAIAGLSVELKKPKEIIVFLNGQAVTDRIPIRINSLLPGNHVIEITAAGYRSWKKSLHLANRETFYVRDIELILDAQPAALNLNSLATAVYASPRGGELLTIASVEGNTVVTLFDEPYTTSTIVYREQNSRPLQAAWALGNSFFLLIPEQQPRNTLLVLKPDDLSYEPWPVPLPPGEQVTKFIWQPNSNGELYYSTRRSIFRAHAATKSATALNSSPWADWFVDENILWTIQTSTSTGGLFVIEDSLGFRKNRGTVPATSSLQLVKNNTAFVAYPTEPAAMDIIAPAGRFSMPVGHALPSPYTAEVFGWGGSEIWEYRGANPRLIWRGSSPLKGVWILDEANTLLVHTEEKMFALYPEYQVEIPLLADPEARVAEVNRRQRIIYLFLSQQPSLAALRY